MRGPTNPCRLIKPGHVLNVSNATSQGIGLANVELTPVNAASMLYKGAIRPNVGVVGNQAISNGTVPPTGISNHNAQEQGLSKIGARGHKITGTNRALPGISRETK